MCWFSQHFSLTLLSINFKDAFTNSVFLETPGSVLLHFSYNTFALRLIFDISNKTSLAYFLRYELSINWYSLRNWICFWLCCISTYRRTWDNCQFHIFESFYVQTVSVKIFLCIISFCSVVTQSTLTAFEELKPNQNKKVKVKYLQDLRI